MTVFDVHRQDESSVTQNRQVGTVRRDAHLPALFGVLKVPDDCGGDVFRVEMVFWLVEDQSLVAFGAMQEAERY